MNIFTDWLHGTTSTIHEWTLTDRGQEKAGSPVHKAIFFTSDRQFALLSGGSPTGNPNVYQASLKLGAHVLDISDPGTTCRTQESEDLRKRVVSCRPGKGNVFAEYTPYWESGWRTGGIMKIGLRPGDAYMAEMSRLALYERKTAEGLHAWNVCQQATRDCIEDIVNASRAAGYQAVSGNEMQDGVTYPLLIVLDPSILTSPVKV